MLPCVLPASCKANVRVSCVCEGAALRARRALREKRRAGAAGLQGAASTRACDVMRPGRRAPVHRSAPGPARGAKPAGDRTGGPAIAPHRRRRRDAPVNHRPSQQRNVRHAELRRACCSRRRAAAAGPSQRLARAPKRRPLRASRRARGGNQASSLPGGSRCAARPGPVLAMKTPSAGVCWASEAVARLFPTHAHATAPLLPQTLPTA